MVEPILLSHYQDSVKVLLDVLGDEINNCAENKERFSIRFSPILNNLKDELLLVSPYTDLISIRLDYEIQNCKGNAIQLGSDFEIDSWEEDNSLSPQPILPSTNEILENLYSVLSNQGNKVPIQVLVEKFIELEKKGSTSKLELTFFINKKQITREIAQDDSVAIISYISSAKLLEELKRKNVFEFGEFLIPESETILLFLLGNTTGLAEGTYIRIAGVDQWTSESIISFQIGKVDEKRIKDVIIFKNEENYGNGSRIRLTPLHVQIDESNLAIPNIQNVFSRIQDQLSISYLANRVNEDNDLITCNFSGYKQIQINISSFGKNLATDSLFKLFAWAYDNSSSDKLNIVRQVISLQLDNDSSGNIETLQEKAPAILATAKSNFNLYLRRKVESYFDKRLRVSEFVQNYSEQVNKHVIELTSELVSNLYKTIGVILGVLIAALVDHNRTYTIAFITSLLYLIYIAFILLYLLPTSYFRFHATKNDYQHNISGLEEVLSKDEIEKITGKSFLRERKYFIIMFTLTNIIYASLGGLSIILTKLFYQMI